MPKTFTEIVNNYRKQLKEQIVKEITQKDAQHLTKNIESIVDNYLKDALEVNSQNLRSIVDNGIINKNTISSSETNETHKTALNNIYEEVNKKILNWLIEKEGKDKHKEAYGNIDKMSSSHLAVITAQSEEDLTLIRILSSSHENANQPDSQGKTPLHYAALKNNYSIIKKLIEYCGANVNKPDKKNRTALHDAVSKGRTKILELLKSDTNITITNSEGYTPLHKFIFTLPGSCENQVHTEKINILANDDVLNTQEAQSGMTPLISAIIKAPSISKDNIELLITAKNINMPDKEDLTPMHYAVINGSEKLIEMLEKTNGIDLGKQTERGKQTALHYAVIKGLPKKSVALLATKDNINIKDKSGKTALDYALENKREDISNLLLDKQEEFSMDTNPSPSVENPAATAATREGINRL